MSENIQLSQFMANSLLKRRVTDYKIPARFDDA